MKAWQIDSVHTEVSFSIRHFGIMDLNGSFGQTTGSIELDETNQIKSVQASIEVKSLSTRNKERDAFLLSDHFFEEETYPDIQFISTDITSLSEGTYNIQGNLTLKGISQPVTLFTTISEAITDPFGITRIGLQATTQINRHDFGITFNQLLDNGNLFIGNDVKIKIDSELTVGDSAMKELLTT